MKEPQTITVTLRVNPRMWERIVKMASKTGCSAYTDPITHKIVPPIRAATPEVFAADLLEVGIVEMWSERGFAEEQPAPAEITNPLVRLLRVCFRNGWSVRDLLWKVAE